MLVDIFSKTVYYIIQRILAIILVMVGEVFIVYTFNVLRIRLTSFNSLLLFISAPAFIIIGISVAILVWEKFVKPLMYILCMEQTIAISIFVLDMEDNPNLKGSSLRAKAHSEFKENFLSLVAAAGIIFAAIKVAQKLKNPLMKLKDAIMKNDISSLFSENNNSIFKLFIKFILKNIAEVISMFDELAMSYIWLASFLYNNYESDGKQNGVKAKIKRTALFNLEGIILLLKSLPYLLATELIYSLLYWFILQISKIISFIVIITYWGLNPLTIVTGFIVSNGVANLVEYGFVYSFRLMVMIQSFYKSVSNMEKPDGNMIADTVAKVPCLSRLAKLSKVEELKEVAQINPDDEIQTGLVDTQEVYSVLEKYLGDLKSLLSTRDNSEIDSIHNSADLIEPEGAVNSNESEEIPQEEVITSVETVEEPPSFIQESNNEDDDPDSLLF